MLLLHRCVLLVGLGRVGVRAQPCLQLPPPQKTRQGQVSLHLAASTAFPRLHLAAGNLLQHCLGSESRQAALGRLEGCCVHWNVIRALPSTIPGAPSTPETGSRTQSSSWVPLCLLLPVHGTAAGQPRPAWIAGGGRRGQFLPRAPVLIPHLQVSREPHGSRAEGIRGDTGTDPGVSPGWEEAERGPCSKVSQEKPVLNPVPHCGLCLKEMPQLLEKLAR